MLQTCSPRIPWGGLSCANLFHTDWNVTEPKPRNFIGHTTPTAFYCSKADGTQARSIAEMFGFLQCLVLKNFLFFQPLLLLLYWFLNK